MYICQQRFWTEYMVYTTFTTKDYVSRWHHLWYFRVYCSSIIVQSPLFPELLQKRSPKKKHGMQYSRKSAYIVNKYYCYYHCPFCSIQQLLGIIHCMRRGMRDNSCIRKSFTISLIIGTNSIACLAYSIEKTSQIGCLNL